MSPNSTIWFVCLHGSAKSLMAAQLAQSMAKKAGVPVQFDSAGTEPDAGVPPHVIAGMKGDGVDVSLVKPKLATADLLARASHIVSFGPNLKGIAPTAAQLETWSDVPNVSDGYEQARDAIARKVEALVKRL